MKKIIFFDWNGTLLDDMFIWEKAMNQTFLHFNIQPPSTGEYFSELSTGDYLEVYQKRGINASREKLNEIYLKEYQTEINKAAPFKETSEILQYFLDKNFYLVLLTAQQSSLTDPLLKKFKLKQFFHQISFHSLDKHQKIISILNRLNGLPQNCYLIGDTPSDISHAKKSGIISIALISKFIPEELLFSAEADYYIKSITDLKKIIF